MNQEKQGRRSRLSDSPGGNPGRRGSPRHRAAGDADGPSMPFPLAQDRLVTIVVPAKDEAAAIGRTLRSLPVRTLRASGYDVEVLVLDGRSKDSTPEIARRLGARVVTDPGQGKGFAFRDARRHVRGRWAVMLDADGSYAADAIPQVVDLLARGEADIVMGDRRPTPGSMTGIHRVGNVMLSLQASLLYGKACRDLCTGLWGFRTQALRDLPLRSQGFELEAELFAMAARTGLRIAHVPVDYLPRDGETKLSATRDGMRIVWCLVSSRFRAIAGPVPARALRPPHRMRARPLPAPTGSRATEPSRDAAPR